MAAAAAAAGGLVPYVVTAHKPTAVTQAVVGHFTGPDQMNLIIGKCTRLEIHLLTEDGLQPLLDVPIYGRISALQLYRPKSEATDLLLVLTERFKFCILQYDATKGELVTRANGDVQERIGRPSESGQICLVDPDCRLIGMHLYEGEFKIIPMDASGLLDKEAVSIRLDELQILDMAFLHGLATPTLAVLYQDTKCARHIKTYEVSVQDKDFGPGPWSFNNVDVGASILIPVPGVRGGVIVVGEQSIAFTNGFSSKTVPIRQTIMKTYGRVDEDGARHLLSDTAGVLYLLVLEHNGAGTVTGLKLEPLGETSAASALCYLDNRVVYVGSTCGNSQLVRLLPAPDSQGRFVEVLESYAALGPIVDFSVVDLDRQGQGQVVTCSGIGKDGSLRVVRSGVGINEQAAVELPGIKGIWSLRAQEADVHDTLLVVTFVGETRVLAINAQDELDEIDMPGFECSTQTLLCANATGNQLLQVTPGAVVLANAATKQQVAAWHPPAGSSVTIAVADGHQLLLGVGGGNLVYLEVRQGALHEVAHQQLEHEISCVDCHRLVASEPASVAVAGLWNNTLVLLSLPTLACLFVEKLPSDAIPRSVLLATFDGTPYLLAGLGDGQLCTFVVDAACSPPLRDMKKLSIGTQPISLRPFRTKGEMHAFAASDRPTVVYSLNHKLLFSNVNLQEVNHMCSFNSASFPDSLAVASEDMLTIGTIDDIQKLHVRTVPLAEQPRRIAHQEATHTFLVGCMKPAGAGAPSSDALAFSLRLLDDQTFDTSHSHDLEPHELVCDIISTAFADDPRQYYVVSTAFADPDQPEPVRGRILVCAVEDSRLRVLTERELKAGVFAISGFCGKLVAGVHNKVQLFRWAVGMADDSYSLVPECSLASHILTLTIAVRGEFILVGDLMKSASLIQYKPEAGVLEERARDINSVWTTAAECVDDDTFIVAEAAHNLVVLRKNGEAATDEERHRLDVVAEFHVGHQVNAFAHGSLVMRMPDSDLARVTTLLFGTVSGMIGVVAFLPAQQWAFLLRLQQAITSVIHGVGGLTWADWRGFANERRTAEARNVIDGDLVELFLDLKREQQESIAAQVQVSLSEVVQRLEELARIH